MGNGIGKTLNHQGGKQSIGAGNNSAGAGEVSAPVDDQLANGQHDRTYNPVDGAQRGMIGESLNSDAARYKKGPGPL